MFCFVFNPRLIQIARNEPLILNRRISDVEMKKKETRVIGRN